jgi:anti-anti-sigma regulatory factor
LSSARGGERGRGRIAVEYEPAQDFAAIVTLSGAHDEATVDALKDAMSSIDGDLLVDLTPCTFIESTVIGALVAKTIELRRDGHNLELVAAPGNTEIGQTLERIHIHDVVAVRSSVPEPAE